MEEECISWLGHIKQYTIYPTRIQINLSHQYENQSPGSSQNCVTIHPSRVGGVGGLICPPNPGVTQTI